MPAYSKTTWVNGTTPAINATNLNKIEQGIADAVRKDGSEAMTAQLITVAGSASTPAIAPTGDTNTGIFFPAADTIAFGEGGAEAMRITSAGNVAIGTLSPLSTLHVQGPSGVTSFTGANRLGFTINSPASLTDYAGIDFTNGFENVAGRIAIIRTASGASLSFGTSNLYSSGITNQAMTINPSGNVGIGTTSPSYKFHVTDTLATSTTVGANVIARLQSNASNADCVLQFSDGVSSAVKFGMNAGNFVWLKNATDEIMRLTSAGYLLIGYTSSNGAYPLQVNGQIFATSSTIATSDGKYKKDIVALDGALDIVKALNPVQFSWKDHPVHKFNTDVPTVGFIAQEVEQALADKSYLTSIIKKSECTWETETGETIEREVTRDVEKQVTREVEREITETIDGEEVTRTVTEEITETITEQVTEIVSEPVKETHTEEFLGIAESNLIAILTQAVKELTAKVEALEAKI